MTIDTINLIDNTKDPKLARVELLAAVTLLNDFVTAANAAKAAALFPFDATITTYTTASVAKGLADISNPQSAGSTIAGTETFAGLQAGIKRFTFAQVLTYISGAFKATVNVFTKNQSVASVALTDDSTIAIDASLSNNFKVALTATGHTLGNPTNLTDGMVLNVRITNGGAFTMAFASKWKFDGGVAPTITSGVGKVDLISGIYFADTDTILSAIGQDKS